MRRALPKPLDDSRPVWVAPMAGGPTRPELVVAAARSGHFSQLAAGYKTAAALEAEVESVRAAGVELFGVNLFVPNPHRIAPEDYASYAGSLGATALRSGLVDPLPALTEDDDDWAAKLQLLLEHPVPAVSFTFGLPDVALIEALHTAGTLTIQTVTSEAEARTAQASGIDVLMVQGWAAGGHSGVWSPGQQPARIPLIELIGLVLAGTTVPVVAAGGIATRQDVRAALEAGASAVAVGTAVLRTPESGAAPLYKAALADPRYTGTTLTRAFTGRPARALVNSFVLDHDRAAPIGYPALHHLTRPIRTAATAAGDPSSVNLWAGEGWRSATELPLGEVLAQLSPRA